MKTPKYNIDIFSKEKKNENFTEKKIDLLNIFAENINCRYMLEMPHRGGSNEYPQCMFWTKNKKLGIPLQNPVFLYKSGV